MQIAMLLATLYLAADASFDDSLLRASYPNLIIASVRDAAVDGLVELTLADGQIAYLSRNGNHLLVGTLMDLETQTNLTEQRSEALRQDILADLPAGLFEFPAADSRYWITVITDLDCGFCRRLHQQMADYHHQGISVRYLLMPRAGIGSPAYAQAVAAACTADPNTALTQAMNGIALEPSECTHSIAEQVAVARRLQPTGTPAIITASGRMYHGYLPAAQLAEELESGTATQ